MTLQIVQSTRDARTRKVCKYNRLFEAPILILLFFFCAPLYRSLSHSFYILFEILSVFVKLIRGDVSFALIRAMLIREHHSD